MNAIHVVGIALATALLSPAQLRQPSPPGQPIDGPGGAAYAHAHVVATRLESGASEVHLFEPADPAPASAPVVVFVHGWAGMDPSFYGSWVTHIVRRGFTVVFPRYQADVRTPVGDFTPNALAAIRRGLEELRMPGHVAPDPRGIALVGHSMGGLIAANLAVRAALGDLPPPLALMSIEPGRTWPQGSRIAFRLDDLSVLPSNLLLLTVAGDDDDFVRDIDARRIFNGATGVPARNKNYVVLRSDDHGSPPLVGDHRAPTAPGALLIDGQAASTRSARNSAMSGFPGASRGPMVTDALDYYGTWKLFDGLADAVFRGINREYALGDTREQRDMGRWSDGVPVRQLIVRTP